MLVVEDDAPIADVLRLHLRRSGHGVHIEHDGVGGLAQAAVLSPEAAILDVGLTASTASKCGAV